MTKTVVVGMSGGVDSSVSALLLKEAGYHVIGLFMKNWEESDEGGSCTAATDFSDVQKVCDQIDIPYYTVNFVKEYREKVFSQFISDLKKGLTPNPDVLCNREIKFNVFFDKAMKLGANFLATGHYCQNPIREGQYTLMKGVDLSKDQTYFVYTLNASILEKVLFPVGGLEKKEVRRIAKNVGLATSEKKDSTGICFIGERHFPSFVSQYITPQEGNFETLEGKIVGKHQGAVFYTLGQRKGMGIGGAGEPWYVVDKDMNRNVVYVVQGEDHPALYRNSLVASELSWVSGQAPFIDRPYKAKVRYRQEDQPCVIEKIEQDKLFVRFLSPQRAVTPGQSIVLYDEDVCLGGGVIQNL